MLEASFTVNKNDPAIVYSGDANEIQFDFSEEMVIDKFANALIFDNHGELISSLLIRVGALPSEPKIPRQKLPQ